MAAPADRDAEDRLKLPAQLPPTPTSIHTVASDAAADPPSPYATSPESSTAPTIPSDEDRLSEDDIDQRGRSGEDGLSDSSSSSPTCAMNSATLGVKTPGGWDGGDKPRGAHKPPQPSTKPVESGIDRSRSSSNATASKSGSNPSEGGVQRLSATDMQQLTSSPESLPVAPAPPQRRSLDQESASRSLEQREAFRQTFSKHSADAARTAAGLLQSPVAPDGRMPRRQVMDASLRRTSPGPRTTSTPPPMRYTGSDDVHSASTSPRRYSFNPTSRPAPLRLDPDSLHSKSGPLTAPATHSESPHSQSVPGISISRAASPVPSIIPLPPMSLPTHLQLELAGERPSPLYVHQSQVSEAPYESSAVKFERLKNVLLLPAFLERTMFFGTLACLDAWLYTFTLLPIRFFLALSILVKWWAYIIRKETTWLVVFVWDGLGRLWERGRAVRSAGIPSESCRSRSRSDSASGSDYSFGVKFPSSSVPNTPSTRQRAPRASNGGANGHMKTLMDGGRASSPGSRSNIFRHRRTKSVPSTLSAFHKADLLQGAVIICSSIALMTLDASRMYHFIRAQSAIKLYVIYNILEVGDRLLSALGQDILECLFSSETLSRNASGRSKILLPLGMFLLALVYNCLHSVALYYQVISLNVAVNSYSNALLTLLLSNQFVEIKSTVFKRCEKDNLFQLTCADIVERFQLWIMLLIIGMRNVVEVGGLSVPGAGLDTGSDDFASSSTASTGSAAGGNSAGGPLHNQAILPHSFTVLPSWLLSGEVLSPFLIIIASEMLVDAIKHAYVAKFNNIKPSFYGRILDILSKDYYTNAFVAPSLTRRLGLAVIPLSCLFIRASVQTYHMFLSTHLSMPVPQSTQTSLTEESAVPSSPAMIAALNRFDSLIRDSLGRATYGYPYGSPLNSRSWYSWTSDDFIAALTMVVVFFILFLVLLILKLCLGMILLQYSRNRYAKMKHKEHLISRGHADRESYDTAGRRVGGFGQVEVGDDRQRWLHSDKSEGLKDAKGLAGKRPGSANRNAKIEGDYNGVFRYEMVSKRIW